MRNNKNNCYAEYNDAYNKYIAEAKQICAGRINMTAPYYNNFYYHYPNYFNDGADRKIMDYINIKSKIRKQSVLRFHILEF